MFQYAYFQQKLQTAALPTLLKTAQFSRIFLSSYKSALLGICSSQPATLSPTRTGVSPRRGSESTQEFFQHNFTLMFGLSYKLNKSRQGRI